MKALDTNVLIRFLVRDDEQQADLAYNKLKQAEANQEVLFVPTLVTLELIWVLDSVYELTRQEIIDVLDKLLLLPVLQFEKQSILRNFLSPAQETKLDLSDLLIAYSSKESNCSSVITFDKRASKFELFELLT